MKEVRWVIQNNLIAENDLKQIQTACSDLGIECQEILVIPFSKDLPEFTIDDKINIYYGSTTLMHNIYTQLNKPTGLFFNENYSMENYMSKWKHNMLNSEAKVTTLKDFTKENHDKDSIWFMRPDADDKSFNGDVRTFEEILQFLDNTTKFENVVLNENTKIIIGTPYNISKEWRTYIVDGKVVASSLYRKNFKLHKDGQDKPESMIKFVEDRCKEYMPHPIFAMDIALSGDQYYIIECGCLNSVGLYDSNISDIVKEVSNYLTK